MDTDRKWFVFFIAAEVVKWQHRYRKTVQGQLSQPRAGVIDSQYRGEVKVLLFNHSQTDHPIKKGDRIAQLLIQKVETVEFFAVDDLEDTARGAGGFGSTGG